MLPFDKCKKILDTHISKGKSERQDWDRWHAWYLSEESTYIARQYDALPDISPDQDDLKLDTNYPYAFIDTMIANICPTNPLVTVNARDKDRKEAGRAREALINDTMRRDKMHAKAWDMSTYASMCGRAFSKTIWSFKHKRPITRVVNPRNIFYDMSVDWEDVRYVIEAVPLTKEEFDARVADESNGYNKEVASKAAPGAMPSWLFNQANLKSFLNDGSRSVFEWVIVYEFYDLTAGRMYHMLEHADQPLFDGEQPYKFVGNPYSMLAFNKNMMDNSGVSDIKLISRIQERLNELDALELVFTHSTIPVMIMNGNAFDNREEAISTMQNASGPGDIATLNLVSGMPFDAAITYKKSPALSPSFDKMRERCTALIEFILGIPQYARGVVGGAEVATEVALADTATRTRNGRRIKVIEDWIVDTARKTLGLWREFFPQANSMILRGKTTFESVEIDKAMLAFPVPIDPLAEDAEDQSDDDWYYDYETVPYSPTENHKLVQLQKLQQFMQFLMNNPAIDPGALMFKLTELLGIEEVRRDPGAAPPGQPGMPNAPAPPGAQSPAMSGTSADVIPTNGALPNGVEQGVQAILPPAGNQMASQPKA